MTKLDLRGNKIGDVGAQALGQALVVHVSLPSPLSPCASCKRICAVCPLKLNSDSVGLPGQGADMSP